MNNTGTKTAPCQPCRSDSRGRPAAHSSLDVFRGTGRGVPCGYCIRVCKNETDVSRMQQCPDCLAAGRGQLPGATVRSRGWEIWPADMANMTIGSGKPLTGLYNYAVAINRWLMAIHAPFSTIRRISAPDYCPAWAGAGPDRH